MALPPSIAFTRIGTGAQVLEVYLDTQCPFSAKIARSITANVLPLIRKGGKYEGKLQVLPRMYPQPWHYSGVYHAEAVLAVGKAYPGLYWDYLLAVFEKQATWFNQPTADMTPSQIRDQLVELAMPLIKGEGPQSAAFGKLREALEVRSSPNGGNETTLALKYGIKLGRQNGVHVTPTVLVDGLKEDSVSSSWGSDEWEKFLAEKIEV